MATTVRLQHPVTGITKKGLYGFSWTTLFFGPFPAMFRGDYLVAIMLILFGTLTCGLAGIIWAFLYNRRYTLRLIEQGYELADTEENNAQARCALGISEPSFERKNAERR